jgi:hypothetical protein
MTMSHIPSSAMPHAGPSAAINKDDKAETTQQSGGIGSSISDGAGKIADYARENPKTAAAAGAAIVAGLAAAAIPLVRGRKGSGDSADNESGGSKSGGSKSGGSSGAKSKKSS